MAARKASLMLIGVCFCLCVIMTGLVLLHLGAALVIYSYTENLFLVAVTMLALGACYAFIPLLIILHVTSERVWIRWFRVQKVVEFASNRQAPDG